MNGFEWDDTRIEKLKTLVRRGVGYREIGRQLGCTRNAALGKAHRLGIAGKGKVMKRRKVSHAQARHAGKKGLAILKAGKPPAQPTLPLPVDAVPAKTVSFEDLQPEGCRWLYGDPAKGGGFCTNNHVPGGSYCAQHMARAYLAPEANRTNRAEKLAQKPHVSSIAPDFPKKIMAET